MQWITKYAPKKLNDVILEENVIKQLNIYKQNPKNVIICGNTGLGKTIAVKNLVKEILGESLQDNLIEINTTNDRGIKSINETIITFNKKYVLNDNCKILIIDDMDSVSNKSQLQISNLIDECNDIKFIFICEQLNNVINSIQSKCNIIIRFTYPSNENIKQLLIKICNNENIDYTEQGLDMLINMSNYDIRQIIINMNSVAIGFGYINEKNVSKIYDKPEPELIKDLLNCCIDGDILKAIEMSNVLIFKGFLPSDILSGFFEIIDDINITSDAKMIILHEINKSNIEIFKGNLIVQLNACFCRIVKKLKEYNRTIDYFLIE